jgi:hypothetical protein
VLKATRRQHAIRLLSLLHQAGEPTGNQGDEPGAVLVMRSELRLQALDFWLRNPDYLADELLTEVQAGRLEPSYVDVAETLLSDPEPAWHHYPMPKWFHGAYERLDDAFAVLEVYGLAVMRRKPSGTRNQFFLMADGVRAAEELGVDGSALEWYPRQVRFVLKVAGGQVGSRLKERQYRQAEYAGTELGVSIGPIRDRVLGRLAEMKGQA